MASSSSPDYIFDPATNLLNSLPPEVDEFQVLSQLNTNATIPSAGSFNPSDFTINLSPPSPISSSPFIGERDTFLRPGSTPALAAFGRIIKRNKKFPDNTEAEFDAYCQTVDVEERMLIQFAVSLEIRDMLKELQKPENWVISDDLKKNIGRYTKAFMLSPTVTSYKGNVSDQILKLMREHNVRDLPSEKQAAETAEVLSSIGATLTTTRNVLKSKIKASLSADADKDAKNIANLTDTLISSTNIKHSLQLYMRIAFLRWVMVSYPKEAESATFWVKVDFVLKQWRSEAQDLPRLTAAFNKVYQDDVAAHGDPSKTTHEVVSPKNIPVWFQQVDSYAASVQSGVAVGGKGKRRHVAPADEDDDV